MKNNNFKEKIKQNYKRIDKNYFGYKEIYNITFNQKEVIVFVMSILIIPFIITIIMLIMNNGKTLNIGKNLPKPSSAIIVLIFLESLIVPLIGLIVLLIISGIKIIYSGVCYVYAFLLIPILFSFITGDTIILFYLNFIFKIILIILCFVFVPELKNSFKLFKKSYNLLSACVLGIILVALSIAFAAIGNIITSLFTNEDATNQQDLNDLLKNSYIKPGLIIEIIILAPLVEEITVRRSCFRGCNNSWLGYIVSSVFFAYMHVQQTADLIHLLNYLLPSLCISLGILMTKNVLPGIIDHALLNIISLTNIGV